MKIRNQARGLFAVLTASSLLLSCGSDPTSVGLDDDAARDAAYGGQTARVWNALADVMGMGRLAEKTQEDLVADLAKSPEIYAGPVLGDDPSTEETEAATQIYQAFEKAVGGKLVQSAVRTQCGQVVGLTEARNGYFVNAGTTVPGASKFHVMQYKLRDAAGKVEDLVRQALVSVPTAAHSNVPLVLYAHAQAEGLVYEEIASIFSSLQAKAIIAAPSFNGELITTCVPGNEDTTCSDAIGEESFALPHPTTDMSGEFIFDDDAVDMLGLYSCVATALAGGGNVPELKKSDYTATGNDLSPFNGVKTFAIPALDIDDAIVPYLVFAGVDRGAFTAQLAAARAGLILADMAKGDESSIISLLTNLELNPATFVRAMPQGVLAMGSHASMTMGFNRIALQLMVQGGIDKHPLGNIPGFVHMGGLLNDMALDVVMATGTDTYQEELLKLAAEVAVRDLAYMGRYVPVAVRDWKTSPATGGTLALLHGIDNKAIAYSQARAADGIYKTYNAAVVEQSVPAINHHVFAFKAPDEYFTEDGQIKDLNHVADDSFLEGELVGLTAAQLGVITGQDTSGADTDLNTLAAQINGATEGAIPTSLAQATLYPLFARDSSYNAFNPDADTATPLTNVTPAGIAGGWFSLHAVKAATP